MTLLFTAAMERIVRDGHLRCFVLMVFCGYCSSGMAFDSDEHQRIGDAAIFLAVISMNQDRLAGDNAKTVCPMMAEMYRTEVPVCRNVVIPDTALAKSSAPQLGLYGMIASCVDQVEAPSRFFALFLPKGNRGADEVLDYWKAVDRICLVNEIAAAIAARFNASHFQGAAISSFRLHHVSALYAASQGEIFQGLVRNAAADHYLMDFHAGGHVVTDRNALVDSMALGTHDKANRIGVPFFFAPPESVKLVIRTICHDVSIGPALLNRVVGKKEVDGVFKTASELNAACDTLSRAIDNHESQRFRGDGYLFSKKSLAQRLYLLAVQTASISEVLAQVKGDDGAEAPTISASIFEDAEWTPACNVKDGACDASLGVGFYDLVGDEGVVKYDDDGGWQLPQPLGGPYSILVGGSLGFSTLAAKSRFGKRAASLDVWIPINGPENWWIILGPTYAYEVEGQIDYEGYGWEARLAKGWPQLPGTIFSVYYRYVRYSLETDVGHLSTDSYGVRVDHGMSDLVGLFVAYQHDNANLSEFGRVFEGNRLSLGLTFKIPATRLPGGLSQIFKRFGF
ncbi:MAG: hypothetical protein HY067_10500 [Betaproteobacteria bacterium]|nr:hypothetical protein [Betaproteobacteria bacterium]